MGTALVLAGGGVAGIAWELGVLRGLADLDPALAERVIAADVIIGTSAGSSVAAQITSGTPLAPSEGTRLTNAGGVMSTVVKLVVKRAGMSLPTRSVTFSTLTT